MLAMRREKPLTIEEATTGRSHEKIERFEDNYTWKYSTLKYEPDRFFYCL